MGAGGATGAGSSGAARPRMERTLDHWLFGLAAGEGDFACGLARGGGGGAGLGGGGGVLSLVAESGVEAVGASLAGMPI